MGDGVEMAQETMEHAHHHAHADPENTHPRNAAILVAGLAACLALAEMGEKAAQNEYLTHHISASDAWAFYQAKSIRATTTTDTADVLESLKTFNPSPAIEEALDKKIEKYRAYAEHLENDPKGGDGKEQLKEKAAKEEEAREHALHRYHHFEMASGGLQISIVLASVSVVTKNRGLLLLGAGLGILAAALALAISLGVPEMLHLGAH